jgi:NADPH-dependent 7-cyano-7-deazaguanine reductase QueF-like protein
LTPAGPREGNPRMNANEKSLEKVRQDLSMCESRMNELVAAGKASDLDADVDSLNSELKSCKLELNALEDKSGDDWEDAKNSVVRRLGEVRRSLGMSSRGMV